MKKKIYMGIPSTGDRADIHTYLFRDLQERYADEIELVFPEQCIHRFGHDFARNEIVEEFLESDCDILWFLDSDVCPPKHILDLVTIHGDKWLAAGSPYPLWMVVPGTSTQSVVFTAYNGVVPASDGRQGIKLATVNKHGTEFVDALATGCLFLKREVFKDMEKPYFQFKRDPKSMNVIEGEDLGFALKLAAKGIQFFCDHGMVCKHYKRVDLLEVNNYAIEMSNNKVIEYDQAIRAQMQQALKAAYEQGMRDARGAPAPAPKTKSGLILPSHLST